VNGNRWVGISVGTLLSSLSLWFGILAIPANVLMGLVIAGVGIAFAMYAVAGFSGAENPMDTGFASALVALIVAASSVAMFGLTGIRPFIVLAPVLAIGFGGTWALAPTRDKRRNTARLAMSSVVAVTLYLVFTVEPTAFGLMAPLFPLPALGIADRLFDRGRDVIHEQIP